MSKVKVRTLEEERPMEADLLSRVGMSNGCTVRSSVHSVVVVDNLLRGHGLMGMRGKSQSGNEGKCSVLYSNNMVGSCGATARLGNSLANLARQSSSEKKVEQASVKNADSYNTNQGDPIGRFAPP
jgi:hypothetical protein